MTARHGDTTARHGDNSARHGVMKISRHFTKKSADFFGARLCSHAHARVRMALTRKNVALLAPRLIISLLETCFRGLVQVVQLFLVQTVQAVQPVLVQVVQVVQHISALDSAHAHAPRAKGTVLKPVKRRYFGVNDPRRALPCIIFVAKKTMAGAENGLT